MAAISSQPKICTLAEIRMWEILEYVGEALVFIGVVGEVWAEWEEPHKKLIAKTSSITLIVGLALSLAALIATNEAFNGKIAELNAQAKEAQLRAAQADLKRTELANRMLDIFGPRQLTPEQSAEIVKKLASLKGTKIDVYVMDIGDPPDSPEFKDSVKTGRAVLRILSDSRMNAEGWILNSCQGATANQLNVSVAGNGSDNDRKIAQKVLAAFPRELGIFSELQNGSEVAYCKQFSDLDKDKPHKRGHDATISITIGKKINPLLTPEMLELTHP